MSDRPPQTLVIYANLKEGILSYDLSSKSLNIDIIFEKINETIEKEWHTTDRLTLILDYGMAEKSNNYILKDVSTSSFSLGYISTLLNYQKNESIRKLHKDFSKDKKIMSLSNINDIIGILLRPYKYSNGTNKFVLILHAEKFISFMNSTGLKAIDFNRNYYNFYFYLYPDSVFDSDYKTLQCLYQPEIEIQLETYMFKLYNRDKRMMIKDLRISDTNPVRRRSLQISPVEEIRVQMPEQLFYRIILSQGWVKIDIVDLNESEVFKYTSNKLILEATMTKQANTYIFMIFYDNVKCYIDDVNNFVLKTKNLLTYMQSINKTDIQIKLLKEYSLSLLVKLFNNKCITYLVDDYDDQNDINDKFFAFYDVIEKQADMSIDRRQFLKKMDSGTVFIQLHRKTRNIFKIYFLLLNQNMEATAIDFNEIVATIKAFLLHIYKDLALILPCKLHYILYYRTEKKQTKAQTTNIETKYMINKLSIGILNNKMVSYTLINKSMAYLSFFATDFEESLIALMKKMGFYLIINNDGSKSVLIFYNLIKSGNAEDDVFIYIAVRYRKNNIKTIRGYSIKQNPFTPFCEFVMQKITTITNVINLYIDQLVIFIGLYNLTMNQIYKTLNRNESALYKKSLYWIKYEIPLTYIAFSQKDIKLKNDKLRYLDLFKTICFKETGNYLFKLLNSKSGIVNDMSIRSASQFSTETIDMNLLCFDAEYMNKDLVENYKLLLTKYADYVYKNKETDDRFYIKLLRSELFIIIEVLHPDDNVILRYHLICLKCIKQHLLKLIEAIDINDPSKTNFNKLLADLECKYKIKNSSMFTGRAISNLRSLLDAEYIMLVRKALNSSTSEILKVSDFENVFPITDTETEGINIFAKALVDMDNNKIEFDPVIHANLSTIFDLIFSTFFEKMNYRLTDDGSIMHLLNFSDKSLDTSKCNDAVKRSPIVKLIELNQTFFQSYLKQISSNVNLILIKMYVINKANNRYFHNFNKFLEIIRELGPHKKLNLMYRIHSPQFKNLPKKVSSELYYELKASPELNSYLKNEYFSTLYYSSSYTYEFNNVKKKIWKNYILLVFNSFFSCLSLELFFMNRLFFANHYQYLCKSLENCHNKCVIKFKFLQSDITSKNIGSDIKKKNYIIMNVDKKDSGISIIPRYAKENVFFNFIFYKSKIEILWYKSLGFSLKDDTICIYCREVNGLLESKPSITYYELLTKYKSIKNPLLLKRETDCYSKIEESTIKDSFYQNIHKSVNTYMIDPKNPEQDLYRSVIENHDEYKCLKLCTSVCDILDLIYKYDAVYLLNNIKNKYISADDIENLLEEEYDHEISKPFLKLIHNEHIDFIDIEQNPKKLYYSLLNDPTLSFLRVSANCFLFEIDGKDYLIRLIPVDEMPIDESSSSLLIHFYGVEHSNSGSHFNKIFRIFEQKINQIITKTIENLFFEKKPIIYKNSVIYKYINKNFQPENFNITIVDINISVLLLFFKQVVGSYLRPVIGALDFESKGNIQISHEDIGFFYIIVDQNDILFGGNSIFYIEHDHKDFTIRRDPKLETVDNRYAYNVMNNNKLSNMFTELEDETLLNQTFLQRMLDAFKYNDPQSANSLTFIVKKKKNDLGVDDIGNTIFRIFKECMVEYYIEAVLSVYMLRYNPYHIKKDLLHFLDIIQNAFTAEILPKTFYTYKRENKFYKTYLFYNYLIVCQMVEDSFFNAELNFIYMYYNQKQDKRIISNNRREFEQKMKTYFEERNVLFEEIELNFSFLVLPKGVKFDYCGNKLTPQYKLSAPNLVTYEPDDLKTGIRKKSKSFISGKIENVNIIYDEIQLYKCEARKIIDEESTVDIPIRRFFYLLNINYETINFYTYNIKQEINQDISIKIDDYINTIKLKRKLFRFVSIQKLGIHEKVDRINDDYDTIKSNTIHNDNFYTQEFKNIQQIDKKPTFRNYTDFIQKLLCGEEDSDDAIYQLLRDKKFKEKITTDFYKLQFSLVNNYKFNNQELVHFNMVM